MNAVITLVRKNEKLQLFYTVLGEGFFAALRSIRDYSRHTRKIIWAPYSAQMWELNDNNDVWKIEAWSLSRS